VKYNKWAFDRFPPDGYDGEFDWDFLKDVWGGRIEPMDFDCVVEKGGEFLVLETKGRNGHILAGHERVFQNLIESPKWTLMVIYGKLPETVEEIFIYHNRQLVKHIKPATNNDLIRECANWASKRSSRYVNGVKIGR
jgi:hypothetical protein